MPDTDPNTSNRMQQILAMATSHVWRRRSLFWLLLGASLLLIAGLAYLLTSGQESGIAYQTAVLQQGQLTVRVTATGVLQPVNQIEVGTEISGTIKQVEVDFNSRVKRGDVLARLDTERLEAQVVQARASLQSANARVEESGATVLETRVRMERCDKLAKQQLCSREDLDTLRAAHARARAAEASARAQVALAKAALDAHETDLAKAIIRAPIDGIILKRQIEPGQTVAASLQTPVLFILAENLAQMELQVAIDEADIGQIREGQQADFGVDAYPSRRFPAVISQVRFAPQTVEGVVTYETVLSVDNSELLLRPGMTATVEIITHQLQDVLLVPNMALRFSPPASNRATRSSGGSLFSRLFPRPGHSQRAASKTSSGDKQRVWILEDDTPRAVSVKVGPTDGQMSQLLEGDVQAGQSVITDSLSRHP